MKICIHFDSFKDYSNIRYGQNILNLLTSYGFKIEKYNDCEPINKLFFIDNFEKIWKDFDKKYGNTFLFKGNFPLNFKGMISWSKNLQQNNNTTCGINLWLNVNKNYPINNIIDFSDELFFISEAVYGYISNEIYDPMYGVTNIKQLEKCKYPDYVKRRAGRYEVSSDGTKSYHIKGGVYNGIKDLMWINYFASSYINEDDFTLLENNNIIKNGVKFRITEKHDDEILCEPEFLEKLKRKIGIQWFWQNPKECELKTPNFDKSEITQ